MMIYETTTTKALSDRELAEAIVDDRIARGQFSDDDRDWLLERELRETRESLVNGFNAIERWDNDDNSNDDSNNNDSNNNDDNNNSETYVKMSKRHQNEWDSKIRELYPMVFYAIGDTQFCNAVDDYTAAGGTTDSLVMISAGLYGDENYVPQLMEIASRNSEELHERLTSDYSFAHDAIIYEMDNHEYGWAQNDEIVLESLGIVSDDLSEEFNTWYESAREDYLAMTADYMW